MTLDEDELIENSAGAEHIARKPAGVNLVEGPVGGHLLSLGVFLAISVFGAMATSLADIYFVARLGPRAVAALSFTFPVVLTVSAIALGLGNGVVSVISRALGEGDHEGTRAQGTDSLLLGVIIVLILTVLGYVSIDPVFKMLGADQDVLPLIQRYMRIWYLGTGLQVIPPVAQAIIRAYGDTKTPSFIVLVVCAINVALDPILIFGWGPIPAFGMEGAAYAMITARIFFLLGMVAILHFRLHGLAPISFAYQRLNTSWRKLLHIGLPSTAAQMVSPVSAAILTKVVAMSGTLAVAAWGVASRIELVTVIYVWAVAGGLAAFVGQNAGAGHMDRVRRAVSLATKFCMYSGASMIVVAAVAAPQIVDQFTDVPEIKVLAVYYLRIASFSYPFAGLVTTGSQTMNALARPMPAAVVSLLRTAGITVPLALLGQWLWNIHGLFIGIALGYATCGALSWLTTNVVMNQEARRLEREGTAGAGLLAGTT